MRAAALVIDAMGVLRGPEDDEDDELLLDVLEAVLGVGGNEDHRSGRDGAVLVADADPSPAGDHVVDLVLGVGALRIARTGGQDVQPDGQVVGPDELVVQPA